MIEIPELGQVLHVLHAVRENCRRQGTFFEDFVITTSLWREKLQALLFGLLPKHFLNRTQSQIDFDTLAKPRNELARNIPCSQFYWLNILNPSKVDTKVTIQCRVIANIVEDFWIGRQLGNLLEALTLSPRVKKACFCSLWTSMR